MAAWRTFVVSPAGLAAYHRQGSKLLDPIAFDADEDGLARFAQYLERFPDDVTCILADVVEEEFREETVPHALPWERGALLRTRTARAFPAARYVHAARLGRQRDGRRDDHVLLSAITRPETLAPWLAAMERHGVRVAGIYSPAILTAAVLNAVGAGRGLVLVVSEQCGGGLRQTCFRGGKLRLSRLASMPEDATGRNEPRILAEIERTRRYLGSLHSGPEGDGLEVRVLSHGERLEGLRRELARDAGGEIRAGCRLVDLAAAARRLGMHQWNGGWAADPLFVHLLASRRLPNHYATRDQTHRHVVLRTRRILRATSVGILAAACVFGGGTALEGAAADGHARSLALHAAIYERRYAEAQATLPPIPVEPGELERVVSVASTLERRRANPMDLLALVSDALTDFPEVRIESLSWRASDDPDAPVTTENDDRGDPRASGVPSLHDPDSLFLVARANARIEPFDGDYRAAIETIRRFSVVLAAPPAVEQVRILTLPLELGSEHALTGVAGATLETAEFEIRVALRIPVPAPAQV